MSYARSPRLVCSMTMGTSTDCCSFTCTYLLTQSHSNGFLGRKLLARSWGSGVCRTGYALLRRTCDRESLKLSRFESCFGFYRALLRESNVREWLLRFVVSDERVRQFLFRFPRRR